MGKRTTTPYTEVCSETGGPHNLQHLDPEDDESELYCVDCQRRPGKHAGFGNTMNAVAKIQTSSGRKPDFAEGDLEVGDVVALMSHGPVMTVYAVLGDTVTCIWFSRDGILQQGNFIHRVLRLPRVRTV